MTSSQSVNQSINLLNQPVNRSIDQPVNQSINQSIDQSINQSINVSSFCVFTLEFDGVCSCMRLIILSSQQLFCKIKWNR